MTTAAPACASPFAMPSPMPLLPPVTRATLPVKSNRFIAQEPFSAIMTIAALAGWQMFHTNIINNELALPCIKAHLNHGETNDVPLTKTIWRIK